MIGNKLALPQPLGPLVERPHLIETMAPCRSRRVTLLSAPAGYGKTTLVAQCLESTSSTLVAWLSVDRLDNDLERFVRYVAAALAGSRGDRFPETEQMLAGRTLPPPPVLAESLIAAIEGQGRQKVLVLDDYGLIQSEAVHEFVTALISNCPSTFHVVIVSRIDPALPLALWRSRHWLRELRAADLRFTREEPIGFLSREA